MSCRLPVIAIILLAAGSLPAAECLTSGGTKSPTRDLFWHFPGYLGARSRRTGSRSSA